MSKVKLLSYIAIAVIAYFIAVTYGRWEYLTWQKGHEFIQPLEQSSKESEFNPNVPSFLRVIKYDSQKAQVFTREGRIEYMLFFAKDENSRWDLKCYDYCLASNGSNSCIFPYYSRDFMTQIGYYSPNGSSCQKKGY